MSVAPQIFVEIIDMHHRYVPQPRSGVFRVTNMNHNILQGVSKEGDYLSEKDEELLRDGQPRIATDIGLLMVAHSMTLRMEVQTSLW